MPELLYYATWLDKHFKKAFLKRLLRQHRGEIHKLEEDQEDSS